MFSKNRERLIEHDVVVALINEIVEMVQTEGWLSGEHFSVDGTLIQAWAGHKSFMRKDGDDDGDGSDFRAKPRSNDTHASKTDPDACLCRKGNTASALRYIGRTVSDNRHRLIANARVMLADGYAEREAVKAMINDARQANPKGALTLGADIGLRRRRVYRRPAGGEGRPACGAKHQKPPLGGTRCHRRQQVLRDLPEQA